MNTHRQKIFQMSTIATKIAKTQEELQDMVNRLVDTGRKYGLEINIDKSQVMRVSRLKLIIEN